MTRKIIRTLRLGRAEVNDNKSLEVISSDMLEAPEGGARDNPGWIVSLQSDQNLDHARSAIQRLERFAHHGAEHPPSVYPFHRKRWRRGRHKQIPWHDWSILRCRFARHDPHDGKEALRSKISGPAG